MSTRSVAPALGILAWVLGVLFAAAPAEAWRGGYGGHYGGGRGGYGRGAGLGYPGYRGLPAPFILSNTAATQAGLFYYQPGDPRSCRLGWLDELPDAERGRWIDAKEYGMPGWRCPAPTAPMPEEETP